MSDLQRLKTDCGLSFGLHIQIWCASRGPSENVWGSLERPIPPSTASWASTFATDPHERQSVCTHTWSVRRWSARQL